MIRKIQLPERFLFRAARHRRSRVRKFWRVVPEARRIRQKSFRENFVVKIFRRKIFLQTILRPIRENAKARERDVRSVGDENFVEKIRLVVERQNRRVVVDFLRLPEVPRRPEKLLQRGQIVRVGNLFFEFLEDESVRGISQRFVENRKADAPGFAQKFLRNRMRSSRESSVFQSVVPAL